MQRKETKIPKSNSKAAESSSRLQIIRKALAAYITQPIVILLAKTSVTPNTVTWIGFIIILAAAGLAASGRLFAAGWVMLLSGFFDIIDGALARHTGQVTRFGGVLDSTLDRLSEAAVLLGIMAFFLFHSDSEYVPWITLLIGVTLIFSFLVSYIRSRAEGAGIDCQVGVFTRTERVIILALGLLIGLEIGLIVIMGIIALLSIVTVFQRLLHVYRRTGGK
jgi:CDP-diacylglycerol---glycerol-3-phosphate 3-phosphatidyltransferase